MRVLYIQAGGQSTVFTLAPLATALRNAGHQVVMAGAADTVPAITSMGLPAIRTTSHNISHFIMNDRRGNPVAIPEEPAEQALFTGRWFGRLAAESLAPVLEFAREWRPDIVVGGTMSYAAPLVARSLGVPWVRQAWDGIDATAVHPGADDELQPELAPLGLDRIPEPDLFVDICPPSLRSEDAPAARMMRFVPANRQRELEPWMYTRGAKKRICVTAGSRVRKQSFDDSYAFLTRLVTEFADWDAELVVAAPEEAAAELRADLPGVHVGWLPMDVIADTCDVLVHHAGGASTLNALHAGLPQLIVAKGAVNQPLARRVADRGAAISLHPGEDTAEAVAKGCRDLLDEPLFRERARDMAAEIARMPLPGQVAGELESLL